MDSTPQIPVLYEDEHLIIVNKPADLLSVPGRGPDKQDCLINRLLPIYPNARIIHRLDMATSGLLALALSHEAQAAMSTLFAERQIHKTYHAIVAGQLAHSHGEINAPLLCDWENRPKQKVDTLHGKSARTTYILMDYDSLKDTSYVELTPHTGRSHQLRVHMLSIGHPILGDYFYAPEVIKAKSARLLLHAYRLAFTHPISQDPVDITASTPF